MHESEKCKWSCSVVSDSSRPHGLQPTRLLHPWDFPGKSTGVGCHCLFLKTITSYVLNVWTVLYVRYSSVKLLWKKVTHTSYLFSNIYMFSAIFWLMISSLIGLIVISCPQLHLDVHLIIFILLFYRLHTVFLFIYLSDFLFWIIAAFFLHLIRCRKSFLIIWTSIYDKSSPESGHTGNIPHNI